jgi:hypothetical protein
VRSRSPSASSAGPFPGGSRLPRAHRRRRRPGVHDRSFVQLVSAVGQSLAHLEQFFALLVFEFDG